MKRSRRGWMWFLPWILLLCAIFVCAAAFCLQNRTDVQYRAVYTLYVTPDAAYDADPEQMARECQILTQTDAFRKSVLANTQSDGKTRVTVKSVENTCVLELAVVGPDASIVGSLANAAGDELCMQLPLLLPVQNATTIQRASVPLEADRFSDRVWLTMVAVVVLLAFVLLLCCCDGREVLSFSSPRADDFCLGGIHDVRRSIKLCLKKRGKKDRNMIWECADRSVLEEVRQLVLRLRVAPNGNAAGSFLMTAVDETAQDEAVTALLASELAQQGFRVLLLEAGEHAALTEELLNVRVQNDLCDYLSGHCKLTDAMAHTRISTLFYMRAHRSNQAVASFAATAGYADLMKNAKACFDFVIVHAAPVYDASDAAMLCLSTDAVVLLAQDERCTLEQIEKAAMGFAKLHRPARGVVFTRV